MDPKQLLVVSLVDEKAHAVACIPRKDQTVAVFLLGKVNFLVPPYCIAQLCDEEILRFFAGASYQAHEQQSNSWSSWMWYNDTLEPLVVFSGYFEVRKFILYK